MCLLFLLLFIGTTANNFSVELSQFRKDRLVVEPLKEDYLKESDSALSEMRYAHDNE